MTEPYHHQTIASVPAAVHAQPDDIAAALMGADQGSTLKALQDAYAMLLEAWSENERLRALVSANATVSLPLAPASLSVN